MIDIRTITFVDCADHYRQALFWGEVTGYQEDPDDPNHPDDPESRIVTPYGVSMLFMPPPDGAEPVQVPEGKTVKNRVHLDVYARDLADLEALGATVLEPRSGKRTWTVMADPEGGEFCAFLRAEPPDERLHALVVDCADPEAQARWWGRVYGVDAAAMNGGWFSLEGIQDMPIRSMDFVPVPEPKTAKNRVHWDVTVSAVAPLASAGAVVLREPDGEIDWYVMADPEGNEFCAFTG